MSVALGAASRPRRLKAAAFWLGCLAVTAGVLLHLPMYWMARFMGWRLAGMEMDAGMIWGMALIVGGVGLTAYGCSRPR